MMRHIAHHLRQLICLGAWAFGACVLVLDASPVEARITRIVIQNTVSPAFGGASFGAAGPYEQLDGVAYGEVDPRDALNAIIQDIALAPRNARGMVEYAMDISILKPIDMARGNGTLLYDVVNRGNKVATTRINIPMPGSPGAGDGFLQSRGTTIVWSGWQGDLTAGGGRLTLRVPVARNADGSPITGRVRMEYDPEKAGSTQPLGARFSAGYEPVSLDNASAVLTARVHQDDARVIIPNDQWAFADCSSTPFPGVAASRTICLKDGFDTDHIYELTYEAKDPLVLGLGFAATRDLVAFLRHGGSDPQNPLGSAIRSTLLHGSSQSGRYARGFLSLGFNQDEDGRIVFDGMNPNISPARIALNLRFAQPGRDSGLQHIEHHYPGTDAPVTWLPTPDPITGELHGLLDRCTATKTCPKIIQTVTDTEYWQRGMSLNTADATGARDLEIPGNVRIFHMTGSQHTGSVPGAAPAKGICQLLSSPASYHYTLRALMVALQDWVTEDKEPPASRYPSIAAGTLVAPDPATFGFPKIPGLKFTAMHNPRTVFDRGAQFNAADLSAVMTEPPVAKRDLVVLMPKVDADGNGVDGVRPVALQAPLGTYLGWNYRAGGFGEGDLCDNTGGFIPFAATKAERLASGDPRLSLEERYGTHGGYVTAVKKAADALVAERLMLPEDVAGAVAIAQASKVLQ
jgi:Alpha/beta hydrolase domain